MRTREKRDRERSDHPDNSGLHWWQAQEQQSFLLTKRDMIWNKSRAQAVFVYSAVMLQEFYPGESNFHLKENKTACLFQAESGEVWTTTGDPQHAKQLGEKMNLTLISGRSWVPFSVFSILNVKSVFLRWHGFTLRGKHASSTVCQSGQYFGSDSDVIPEHSWSSQDESWRL